MNQYQIDRYILGKMSPEEILDFEKMMEESPKLKEQVHLSKIELNISEEFIANGIRNKIKELRNQSKNQSIFANWNLLVGFIIFLVMGYFLWTKYVIQKNMPKNHTTENNIIITQIDSNSRKSKAGSSDSNDSIKLQPNHGKLQNKPNENEIKNKQKTKQNLYAKAEKPNPDIELTTIKPIPDGLIAFADAQYVRPEWGGFRSDRSDTLAEIRKLWAERKWSQIITALNKISKINEDNKQIQYYLAHAYYLKNNYSEAEAQFAKLVVHSSTEIKDDAEWFYILSNIKAGKISQTCKALILKINQNPGHLYYDEIVALKNILKE